jgi:chemotaxis protein CheD
MSAVRGASGAAVANGPALSGPPPRRPLYVQPGQICVSAEPAEATTVLGSCVAVCLWDGRLRCGGINHFLLPQWILGANASPRFGNVAIDQLIQKLLALGSRSEDLSAKVFGGAAVLEAFRNGGDHLGARNVEVARRALALRRIPILAEDVLGSRGRKLLFQTATGIALVRLL